jgi:hypothetical protein
VTQAVSADTAKMSALRGSNMASTGSSSITLQGLGFGSAAHSSTVRMGSTRCEATGWRSETAVRCRVGAGGRGTRLVTMTAGEQVGSMTEVWSVDREGLNKLLTANASNFSRQDFLNTVGTDSSIVSDDGNTVRILT